MTELGYDPETEKEKKAEETATAMEMGNQMLTAFDRGQAAPGAPLAPNGRALPPQNG